MTTSFQRLCVVMFVICGLQPSWLRKLRMRQKRMISGNETKENGYPYMVQIRNADDGSHNCGASLIDRSHVLTAAHCLFRPDVECFKRNGLLKDGIGFTKLENEQMSYLKEINECPDVINITQFTVHLGAHERNDTNAIKAEVKRMIPNPYYDKSHKLLHDIAIIEIEPVELNEKISIIKLWPNSTESLERFPPWANGTLTGWGLTEISLGYGGIIRYKFPDQLQVMQMPIHSFQDCMRLAKPSHLTRGKICGGYLEKNFKGACWGDSGGPLVYTWGGVTYQIGIVSHSTGKNPIACGMPGEMEVFEEVYYHIDWINEVIGKGKTVV